ncbi:MAG: hypothetical protein CMO01_08945 [Thalassobius sp.]|nr:hypothetical protein [Thalassovita sp.]
MLLYAFICILFILVIAKLVLILVNNNNEDKGNNNINQSLDPLPVDNGIETATLQENKKEFIDCN